MFIYAVATVAFIHIATLRSLMEVNSKHCRIHRPTGEEVARLACICSGLSCRGIIREGWMIFFMSTPGWSLLGLDHLISHISMFVVKKQQDKKKTPFRVAYLQITESYKNPWLPWEILGNCPHGWEIRMAGTAKHLLNGYQEGMSRGEVRSSGLHLLQNMQHGSKKGIKHD